MEKEQQLLQPFRGLIVDFFANENAQPFAAIVAVDPDKNMCLLRMFDMDTSGHKTIPSGTLPHRSEATEGAPFWDYNPKIGMGNFAEALAFTLTGELKNIIDGMLAEAGTQITEALNVALKAIDETHGRANASIKKSEKKLQAAVDLAYKALPEKAKEIAAAQPKTTDTAASSTDKKGKEKA